MNCQHPGTTQRRPVMRPFANAVRICVLMTLVMGMGGPSGIAGKRILVLPFETRISEAFRTEFGLVDEPEADVTSRITHALRTSRAMDRPDINRLAVSVGPTVIDGFGESLTAQFEPILAAERTIWAMPHEYYLAGRVRDDSSNILTLDASLYKREDDVMAALPVVLVRTIHIEGSAAEAFARKRTLMDFLVGQLLERLETLLDDRIRVLVTPLTFYGRDEEMKELGGMISALLRNRLNLSRSIRIIQDTTTVPPVRIGGEEQERYLARTLPERGRREAARYVMTGSFFKYGASIGIEVSQIDVESGHVVLSKSQLLPEASGPGLYATVNQMGDEVRHGIELDARITRDRHAVTLGFVALPPLPRTSENRKIALDIAATLSRRLRRLVQEDPSITVVIDPHRLQEFVSREADIAEVARDMNVSHLCLIRCERPVDSFDVALEFHYTGTPVRSADRLSAVRAQPERLHVLVDSLTRQVVGYLSSALDRSKINPADVDRAMHDVVYPTTPRSVAVVAMPPYPSTYCNRQLAGGLADLAESYLQLQQRRWKRSFTVVSADRERDRFTDEGSCTIDSLAVRIGVHYLLCVELDGTRSAPGAVFRLVSVTNPFEPPIEYPIPVGEQIHLTPLTMQALDSILARWPATRSVEPEPWGSGSGLPQYSHASQGVRVRGFLTGITKSSGRLFWNNRLRGSIELAFTRTMFNWQLELAGKYDFGKQRGNELVYGRYITLLVRRNLPVANFLLFKDIAFYAGAGPTLVNIVRVNGADYGYLNLAVQAEVGIQFQTDFSCLVYLDFTAQYLQGVFSDVGEGPAAFPGGRLHELLIGFGVGFSL